ncbi:MULTISPECIES: hypothetical protein [Catenuloplanes]|uniref:LysR substrate-binding domain-containing protein n=1 Tax=Catenuloplanes niger TaxID=587534 RepID=A0AAE3ZYX4_9ACTN|nr:hypothetical protein [Catenuloplanes niger]MDR7326310.1 hypothetical protein [Catenuloplanes niger]
MPFECGTTGSIQRPARARALELVADGRALLVVPAGDRRVTLHPELTAVPIGDAPPCRVVVVTRGADRDPLVEAFRESALACLAAPVPRPE